MTATNGEAAPVIASIVTLSKTYGGQDSAVEVQALRSVSIDFLAGEWVAICGQSGSGKSTLMNVLGCLDRPTSGHYFLEQDDVSVLDDDALSEIRGQRIGFVFQSFNLIAQLTVLENLEVPLFYQGVESIERKERAAHVAERVGLAERGHHRPNQLSGGQQQRVAIARALINDPLFLLADEPTGNLDSATGEVILGIFAQLRAQGKTILMVTHEPDVAARADRIITLKDGQVLSDVRRPFD